MLESKFENAAFDILNKVYNYLSPHISKWGWIVIGAFVGTALFIYSLPKIISYWKNEFKPNVFNPEQKRRRDRRRRFAAYIASEIERLNRQEDWDDYHFAELEAEVEALSNHNVFSLFSFSKKTREVFRRESSLSKAIKKSTDKIIQLEGDPGSGKSVALRHVCKKMAIKATKPWPFDSIIPLYINLKELKRNRNDAIDRNLIESFILTTLKRVNDRNIDEFLSKEFSIGLEQGSWFFLFDSFDEIPEVLSSTEEDNIVKSYSDAISDFLTVYSNCRGVVASRHYRSPAKSQWAKFRILPLTDKRQHQLIKKASLDYNVEKEFIGRLGLASIELRELVKNPMLLSLLCLHIKSGKPFPDNAYPVLNTYLDSRINRDKERLKQRYGLEVEEVISLAEKIAYCMAADHGLGLTPTRGEIQISLDKMGYKVNDLKRYNTILDGLLYIKLARAETDGLLTHSPTFTFAHRRFQEYYATSIVLREPNRITERELLTDARWRETAVVLCQTRPIESLATILQEVESLLGEIIASIPREGLVTLDEVAVWEQVDSEGFHNSILTDYYNQTQSTSFEDILSWRKGSIHLLEILQDGFSGQKHKLPRSICEKVAVILLSLIKRKNAFGEKIVLEVAGSCSEPVLTNLLRVGFNGNRKSVRDQAYKQAARLARLTHDIELAIKRSIVLMALDGSMKYEYYSMKVHLARIDRNRMFEVAVWRLKLLSSCYLYISYAGFVSLFIVMVLGRAHWRHVIIALAYGGTIFLSENLLRWGFIVGKREDKSAPALLFLIMCFSSLNVYVVLVDKHYAGLADVVRYAVVVILIGSAYGMLWAFLSFRSIWDGESIRGVEWVVLPLMVLGKVVWLVSKIDWSVRAIAREVVSMGKIVCRMLVEMIALYSTLFILLFPHIVLVKLAKLPVYVVLWASIVLFVIVVVGIIGEVGLYWVSDVIRYYKDSRNKNPGNSEEILAKLCMYNTAQYRYYYIRDIRKRELDMANEQVEMLIRIVDVLSTSGKLNYRMDRSKNEDEDKDESEVRLYKKKIGKALKFSVIFAKSVYGIALVNNLWRGVQMMMHEKGSMSIGEYTDAELQRVLVKRQSSYDKYWLSQMLDEMCMCIEAQRRNSYKNRRG